MYDEKMIYNFPDYSITAAISLGIRNDDILLDLNYEEDSSVDVDFNIVMNEDLEFIEVQGTAEGDAFSSDQLIKLLDLGKKGIKQVIKIQKEVLNI